jgi:uncharacterized protein
MALEELPAVAYATDARGVVVNLLGPGEASLALAGGTEVALRQHTAYPFDGEVRIDVLAAAKARFRIRVRVPEWAEGAMLAVAGDAPTAVAAGRYADIEREWSPGDAIALSLPMQPRVHRRTYRNIQESRAPDGSPVRQQVLHYGHVAFTRGPLVYATGLVDDYKTSEVVRLPEADDDVRIEQLPPSGGEPAPALRVHFEGRPRIDFLPYYGLNGRADRSWRITWLGLAPDGTGADAGDCGQV